MKSVNKDCKISTDDVAARVVSFLNAQDVPETEEEAAMGIDVTLVGKNRSFIVSIIEVNVFKVVHNAD